MKKISTKMGILIIAIIINVIAVGVAVANLINKNDNKTLVYGLLCICILNTINAVRIITKKNED